MSGEVQRTRVEEYNDIYSQDYATMTKGAIEDHLQKNRFFLEKLDSLQLEKPKWVASVSLIMAISVAILGGVIGVASMMGGMDLAKIIWSVGGGMAGISLGVSGVGAIIYYSRRSEVISSKEELEQLKKILMLKQLKK